MIKTTTLFTMVTVAAFICLHSIYAQKINEPLPTNTQWTQTYQPFRIVGNVYYVGTYDLACYLIVTPNGNILINTGLAASASMIKANIETLGFKFTDTKILLTTQAHYDHVAAMALIKKQTGARMMINDKDASALMDGGSSDYELGKNGRMYEPVEADRLLKNNDTITVGNVHLIMLHHPGHTKGSSSFLFDVRDDHKTYKVLIANLPTIITDRKFSEVRSYPDIAKDYAYTLESLKNLSFDLWLSSHANQFGLHAKHKPGDAYNPEAFADRRGYDLALSGLKTEYLKKMETP